MKKNENISMESEEKVELANKLYKKMQELGIGAILDDREKISIGAKMKDCKVLGTPYLVVIGDKQEGDMVELEDMKTGETTTCSIDEIINLIKNK